MATVNRYVDTASSGGDGTTQAHSGGTAAYASLAAAVAAIGAFNNATDDYVIHCAGSAADTAAVVISFGTQLTTGTLTIKGDETAPDNDGRYTGNLTISTGHYRLTNSGALPLRIYESPAIVDGIQIECGLTSFGAALVMSAAAGAGRNYTVKNCRIRASAAGVDDGITTYGGSPSDGTTTIENNLVVGFATRCIDYQADTNRLPTVVVRDNTIYGDGASTIGVMLREGGANTGATYAVKGNAIGNTGSSNAFDDTGITGGGVVTYADNATEDAQGTAGEIAIGTLANAWTSPGTTQGAQFTVKNVSSPLYNAVNPTLAALDITGFTRDDTNHDVGAFEFQAGVGGGAAVTISRGMSGGTMNLNGGMQS